MLFQYSPRYRVNFAKRYGSHSSSLKPETEPANPGEQVQDPHVSSTATYNPSINPDAYRRRLFLR